MMFMLSAGHAVGLGTLLRGAPEEIDFSSVAQLHPQARAEPAQKLMAAEFESRVRSEQPGSSSGPKPQAATSKKQVGKYQLGPDGSYRLRSVGDAGEFCGAVDYTGRAEAKRAAEEEAKALERMANLPAAPQLTEDDDDLVDYVPKSLNIN